MQHAQVAEAQGRPRKCQSLERSFNKLRMNGEEKRATVGYIFPSRGRGSGSTGPQAQRPPRGAGSDTQCTTVGAPS